MKKIVFILLCMCFLSSLYSQSWKSNADYLVVNQLFGNEINHIDVFAFPEILTSTDSIVLLDGTVIQVPYNNCCGYFIDLMPLANWSHECKYCFVNPSMNHTMVSAKLPPANENTTALSIHYQAIPNPPPVLFDTSYARNSKSSDTSHKWAVLISGCGTEPRFWFDLSSVYTVLADVYGYQEAPGDYLLNGFEGRRVIVTAPEDLKSRFLPYSYQHIGSSALNETDPDGIGDFFNWDDYDEITSHSKQNIHNIFKCFAGDEQCLQNYSEQGLKKLTEEDQLFIYITGHGFTEQGDDARSYFYAQEGSNYFNNPKIFDDTLVSWLRNIKCSQMTLVMQNCYSGRFIEKFMDDINNPDCLCKNRVGQSAASADEVSRAENYGVCYELSKDFTNNPFANEFTYYWASAALGYYPVYQTTQINGFEVISKGPWTANNRIIGSGGMNWGAYFNNYEQSHPHYPQYDKNPDSDNDMIISLSELFEFANNLDAWSRQGYYYPYYNDTLSQLFDPEFKPETPQQRYESSFTKEAATLAGYEGQIDGIANSGMATQPYRLCGDIWVGSDSELTMRDEIQSPEDTKIYIKPSGKLLLDGALLTNLPEEDSPMWRGIQVWGNKHKHQLQENGRYWQGILEMQNGAVVQNAVVGVDVWNPENESSTGGIVQATDSRFINNGTAVSFHSYENLLLTPYGSSERISDNISFFKSCGFIVDDRYIGPDDFEMHANLYQVRGIKFKGCSFLFRDNPYTNNIPMGLYAYDAGFKIDGFCSSGGQVYPCQVYDRSSFDGFYKAVVSVNDGAVGLRPFTVNNTEFTNNSFGVYAVLSGYATILNSTFRIGQDDAQCAAGIFVEGTPVFTIEQDTFGLAQQYPVENYGIVVKDSKSQNLIYKNVFKQLYCANLAQGWNNTYLPPWKTNNAKIDILGLEYRCNDNVGNLCDFYVLGGGYAHTNGIQSSQGSTAEPANNTFSQNSMYQFMNYGDYIIDYYCDPDVTNTSPYINSIYAVNLDTVKSTNDCPSHYGSGGIGNDTVVPILSDAQRLQREMDFYNAYSTYNDMRTIYDGLIDGGNTQAEISDIQQATPSDLLALRAQLLGHSPYLSEVVLFNMLDRDDVFPQSVLFEILASNPDELKRDTLVTYLRNMEQPMPDYMIAILQQMANGNTARTAMESQLAEYSQKYRQAAGDIIRSILNDTIVDKEALVGWLGNMGDIESDREIVSIYLEEGNYSDAIALANMFPSLYGLSSDEMTEHNDYMTLLNLYHNLSLDGRNVMQLDSTEKVVVEHIAAFGTGTPKVMAKSIIMRAFGGQYDDCPSDLNLHYPVNNRAFPQFGSSITEEDISKALGFRINVSPNPAITWAAVDFSLPVGMTKAQIIIVNSMGMKVATYELSGKEGQKVFDLRNLCPGVYTYRACCGKYSLTGKLVIVK